MKNIAFQQYIGVIRSIHYPRFILKETETIKNYKKDLKKLKTFRERMFTKFLILNTKIHPTLKKQFYKKIN